MASNSGKDSRPSGSLPGSRLLRLVVAASLHGRLFLATIGAFLVFATASALHLRAQRAIDEANASRLESYFLADELRQTSDDLTRFVRTYVATGDKRFKDHYQEVLDIREGRKPRPLEAHNVYWDLVLENDARPRATGRSVPLLDLMREAGFSSAEFNKLAEAKAASDALTHTEYAAMALIESSKPISEANRARAMRLLTDSTYHQTKVKIMRPIADLHAMVAKRTLQTVHAAERRGRFMQALLVASSLGLALSLWRQLRVFNTEHRTREDTDARYRTVFENAGVGLAEVDDKGRVLNINREFCRILGYTREQLCSDDFDFRWVVPLESGTPPNDGSPALPSVHTTPYVRGDDTPIWIAAHTHPVERPAEDSRTFIAAAIDVTAAKRSEAELAAHRANLEQLVRERTQELTRRNELLITESAAREKAVAALHESEKRFRFIAENTWDVIWVMDMATERFSYVSSSSYRQRGYTAEEVMSQPVQAAMTPRSAELVTEMLAQTKARWKLGERPEILRLTDLEQPHRNGQIIQTEVVATLHSDEEGNLVSLLGVTRDVTERKRTEEAIRRLAFYDPLTRLPNRRLIADRLEHAIARARREHTRDVLLFLDLDGFKPVNDRFGHDVGDWLLQETAGRILACLREADTAARLGGDEFLILLSNIKEVEGAVIVANRIRESLAAPFFTEDGRRIDVSSSIGVACFPDDADNGSDLTRKADQAMYQAKRAGRNTIHLVSRPASVTGSASPPSTSFLRMMWLPSFACGNAAIDGEHQRLMAMASRLLDHAFRADPDTEVLEHDFDELVSRIAAHFDQEETILEDLGYPDLQNHRRLHRELLQQAMRLRQSFQSNRAKPMELVDYVVVRMVREHILKADAAFFTFVAQKPESGRSLRSGDQPDV